MEGVPGITKVTLVGLVLVATALGLGYWLYGLGGLEVQAQERDPTVNLLRNSDATSDKTPLPRLFFLFALRPYQLSLPKCR